MPNTMTPADYLARGDVEGLIEFHRNRWGGLRMEADTDGAEEKPATGDDNSDGQPKEDADERLGDPGKRALEAERTARREAERRAKAAEERATELERANETEAEKRVREAEANGRVAGARAAAGELLRDSLEAAGLAGDDLDDAVEDFNLDRVVKDGRVDMARVRRYVARFGKDKEPDPKPERRGDSGHGSGSGQALGARERAAAAAASRGWVTN